MLTEPERQAILFDWNDTAAAYPATSVLHELVEQQAARTPDASAVQHGARTLPYAELNRRANQLARLLRAKGAGPDQAIGLVMDRSPELLIGILAVLKAGGAYLPLDPNWPDDRLALIAEDSAMRSIVTTARHAARLGALGGRLAGAVIDAQDPAIAAYCADDLALPNNPASAAYILYTSGTTGKPKGIVVPHRGAVNYVDWARRHYLDGERLTFPLFSPITFDLTVTSIFVPLISGGTIVIYGDDVQGGAPAILAVMQDNAVDIIKLTPAHLQLLRDAGIRAPRVRKLILGGEDLK